jgi:cystathionine beta-lyase/cystathionine gamma-synthase
MKRGRSTIAVHSQRRIDAGSEPLSPPLVLASAHRFRDLDALLAASRGERDPWSFYRRYGHPNGRLLEEAMAALEGTPDALACASGMTAVACLLSTLANRGDRVVAARDLYGGTLAYLNKHLPRLGVDVVLADLDEIPAAARGAAVVLIETISNPLVRVAPIDRAAAAARRARAKLVVDNTFATPFLCRPAEWGADVVFHSATKFLNGHGDATGGVICGPRDVIAAMRKQAIVAGGAIGPLDAWLTLRGLKTLGLRVARASENAEKVARFLARHRKILRVNYPRPVKYLERRRGAMLSFEIRGGLRAAARFVRACRLIGLVPSLGDVSTTSSHPARSSHAYLSRPEREAMGVTDGLIRISTGIEDIEDIIEDLGQALARS